ncbi:uncharacterized protein LOC132711152 [Pantherophis guttatus]|uniref:Uncharacterized protein LOC132711152 n=1 Tax=Pantherophis guttatus TaxID=94885 RepID=A0ABM3ZAL5_PANGU|nr:uncharacterized protein LOC132711152 [Pantherophis guttatus]
MTSRASGSPLRKCCPRRSLHTVTRWPAQACRGGETGNQDSRAPPSPSGHLGTDRGASSGAEFHETISGKAASPSREAGICSPLSLLRPSGKAALPAARPPWKAGKSGGNRGSSAERLNGVELRLRGIGAAGFRSRPRPAVNRWAGGPSLGRVLPLPKRRRERGAGGEEASSKAAALSRPTAKLASLRSNSGSLPSPRTLPGRFDPRLRVSDPARPRPLRENV